MALMREFCMAQVRVILMHRQHCLAILCVREKMGKARKRHSSGWSPYELCLLSFNFAYPPCTSL